MVVCCHVLDVRIGLLRLYSLQCSIVRAGIGLQVFEYGFSRLGQLISRKVVVGADVSIQDEGWEEEATHHVHVLNYGIGFMQRFDALSLHRVWLGKRAARLSWLRVD